MQCPIIMFQGATIRVSGIWTYCQSSGTVCYELGTQAEDGALRLTRRISGSGGEAPVVVWVVVPASSNPRYPATLCFYRQLNYYQNY